MKRKLLFLIAFALILATSAEAAGAGGAGTTYFQGLWDITKLVLGDTYIGYIVAALGAGVAGQRWWDNQPGMQVTKPLVLGVAFGGMTGLAEALAGAII